MQIEEKLEKMVERIEALEHEYHADKKVVKAGATIFVVLLVAFFGISLSQIKSHVNKAMEGETIKKAESEANASVVRINELLINTQADANNSVARINALLNEANILAKETKNHLFNSQLRVLSKEGNAWVYKTIDNKNKTASCWNSLNGNNANTGTLELGYLVLGKKLYFGMMGPSTHEGLRVDIVDINDTVLYSEKPGDNNEYFYPKEIDTGAYSGRLVKIRAVDKATNDWDWIAISDFYVE